MPRDNQFSFAGGEIAPNLHGRVDIAKYDVSLALARNFYVFPQGGVTNRPGTKFVMELAERVRLIPFKFSILQTYVLAFGDLTMRVFKDGGPVLEDATNITDLTSANPGVVTSNSHGYSDGDIVFIEAVGGLTEVNNRYFKVSASDANTFRLADITTGTELDTSSLGPYTSGGTAKRVYTLTTPYTAAHLDKLKYTQSFDTMTIVHPSYAPRDLTRTDHDAWTLTEIDFEPEVDTPVNVSVAATVGSGSVTYSYKVTAVVDESGEESLPSASDSVTNNLATSGNKNTITWDAVTGADRYNIYKDKNGVYGYIGSAEGTSFVDDNISADTTDTAPRERNPFNASDDYPSCVTYFQQRKTFANTNNEPQTVWMTQTGHYKNMSVSSPAKDDDAVTFTIAANQVNAIKSMIPLNDLVILTEDGSVIAQGDGEPVTPSNIQVKPQQSEGASDVPPIVSGNSIIFVQERGRKVRDLGYTFESDAYTGNDLTLLAGHLLEDREIEEWAYQKIPSNLIWCVLSDGEGLVLTYVREQQVFAWCRIETDGLLKSVACIAEGNEDAVYWQARRRINGTWRYFIERVERRIDDDVKDCFFVDCGLSLDNPVDITGATSEDPVVITANDHGFSDGDLVDIVEIESEDDGEDDDDSLATLLNGKRFTVAGATTHTFQLSGVDGSTYTAYLDGGKVRKAVTTVSGLEHLAGETVVALADGNAEMDLTVSASGTVSLSNAASRIHVGLGYNCDLETLSADTADGAATSRKKNITKVLARVLRSRGFEAGPDFDTLREVKQREFEAYGNPTELKTGFFELQCSAKWGYEGKLCVRQEYPLPLTILGMSPEVSIGG